MPVAQVWEEDETQPESSQYQAENSVLSLGKLTLKASNFMAKGFPFAHGGVWHTSAIAAGDGRG